ncbi:hypothetical protein IQ266_16130 [filamentous cyanobacterium LEGE 11480]|uniref:Peptidase metallopeptidase domain-containing protein n=1 Tax=Romeriopsis navalis LEGE 11480 TaxID=2777977 RepID=A0A928Z5A3_9CYAN|nr:FG-GAP-like repeat-containing protein [Romeriopsis navalis]MBE9031263.1 hypothetical protein [Romeriopsis navalis LEGE 11480]
MPTANGLHPSGFQLESLGAVPTSIEAEPLRLLWQHQMSGSLVRWQVDAAGQVPDWETVVTPQPSADWQLAATGDFDHDGRADHLWRQRQTGENQLWLATQQQQNWTTVADTQWRVAGVADFNHDRQLDVVWRHQSNGDNCIWLMDGARIASHVEIRAVPDTQWKIGSIVDFNQDGAPDLLWRHQRSGDNALWLMHGTDVIDNPALPQLQDTEWHMTGAADVNHDGATDLLWWHERLGLNVAWLMQGYELQSLLALKTVPDRAWRMVGVEPTNAAMNALLRPLQLPIAQAQESVAATSSPPTVLDLASVPPLSQFEAAAPELLPPDFDRGIASLTVDVGTGLDPRYQIGQPLPVTVELQHRIETSDRVKLAFFLSEDATVSRRDQFLGATTFDVAPTLTGRSVWQQSLELPAVDDALWQRRITAPDQIVYLGVVVDGLYPDNEDDVTNNALSVPIKFSIPQLNRYEFTYHYGVPEVAGQETASTSVSTPNNITSLDADQSGVIADHYQGRVIAYAGTYEVGQWVDVRVDQTQAQTNGQYQITAVQPYMGAESAGWVEVTTYFDHETQTRYQPQAANGRDYLGSESGYIHPRHYNQDQFGQDFYEADVWLTPPPTPQLGIAPRTSDTTIQSLVNPFDYYWDTRPSNGVITYSFYQSTDLPYPGGETVAPVSDAIKRNVRQILAQLEQTIAVEFVEVAETAENVGVIRYMLSDGEGIPFYAYTYYPGRTIGSDVHLNQQFADPVAAGFGSAPGSYGYRTLLHETLHALGLKHPGRYDAASGDVSPPYLEPAVDNTTNTVMTYNVAGFNPITPMSYDLLALQYLYGTPSTTTADTTYRFSTLTHYQVGTMQFGDTAQSTKQAIWDGDGTDTLDFSGLAIARDNWFDLRPGGIITAQAAYNAQIYRDQSTNEQFTTSEYGVVLSESTLIENFVNSVGNDFVIANVAANQFYGYRLGQRVGNDVIWRSNQVDQLWLQDYSLEDLKVSLSGDNLLLRLANDGTIRVLDYLQQPMDIRIDGVSYRYDLETAWTQPNQVVSAI